MQKRGGYYLYDNCIQTEGQTKANAGLPMLAGIFDKGKKKMYNRMLNAIFRHAAIK